MNELAEQVEVWIDTELYGEDETVIVCKTDKGVSEIDEEVKEVFDQLTNDTMQVNQSVIKREGKAYITVTLKAYSKEERRKIFRLASSLLKDRFGVEGGAVIDTEEEEVSAVFNERVNAERAWDLFPAKLKEVAKGRLDAEFSCKAKCVEHFTKDGRSVGTILLVTVRAEFESKDSKKKERVADIVTRAIDLVSRECKGITYLKDRLLKRMNDMDESQKEVHLLKGTKGSTLQLEKEPKTFEESVGYYVSIRVKNEAASLLKATLTKLDIPYTEGGGDVTLFTIDTFTFLTHYDKIYEVVSELRESGTRVDYILKNDVTRTFIKILESHFE